MRATSYIQFYQGEVCAACGKQAYDHESGCGRENLTLNVHNVRADLVGLFGGMPFQLSNHANYK
jgi:hypothetical protein